MLNITHTNLYLTKIISLSLYTSCYKSYCTIWCHIVYYMMIYMTHTSKKVVLDSITETNFPMFSANSKSFFFIYKILHKTYPFQRHELKASHYLFVDAWSWDLCENSWFWQKQVSSLTHNILDLGPNTNIKITAWYRVDSWWMYFATWALLDVYGVKRKK